MVSASLPPMPPGRTPGALSATPCARLAKPGGAEGPGVGVHLGFLGTGLGLDLWFLGSDLDFGSRILDFGSLSSSEESCDRKKLKWYPH